MFFGSISKLSLSFPPPIYIYICQIPRAKVDNNYCGIKYMCVCVREREKEREWEREWERESEQVVGCMSVNVFELFVPMSKKLERITLINIFLSTKIRIFINLKIKIILLFFKKVFSKVMTKTFKKSAKTNIEQPLFWEAYSSLFTPLIVVPIGY